MWSNPHKSSNQVFFLYFQHLIVYVFCTVLLFMFHHGVGYGKLKLLCPAVLHCEWLLSWSEPSLEICRPIPLLCNSSWESEISLCSFWLGTVYARALVSRKVVLHKGKCVSLTTVCIYFLNSNLPIILSSCHVRKGYVHCQKTFFFCCCCCWRK